MSFTAMSGARAVAASVLALLVSCGADDESGYCAGSFARGQMQTEMTCLGCTAQGSNENSAQGTDEAIDDSSRSFAKLNFPAGGGEITMRARMGPFTFPSGAVPGALMKFPDVNLVNSGVTFATYLDGALVSPATGGASVGNGPVPGAGEKTYYSRSTSAEFDELEAQVTISGNAEPLTVSVYEICGDN